MATIDLLLSRLKPDELVVAPHNCYGGTHRLISARRGRGQFGVSIIDQSDETAAISNSLPRLSIGLEAEADLIVDLKTALAGASG
jgi:cystathionine beta-lyase/cystathionine gamma-synthase